MGVETVVMEEILERIKRVAQIIELDAKSPWNKERARELVLLVEAAQRTRLSEQQVEKAMNDAFKIVLRKVNNGELDGTNAVGDGSE